MSNHLHRIILIFWMILCVNMGSAQQGTRTFQQDGLSYRYEQLNVVEKPKALLVLFNGGNGMASGILTETGIPVAAAQHDILTIGIDQSELFLSDAVYSKLCTVITHVLEEQLIADNLFVGGFSLGGFTSLRFTEMTVEKGYSKLIPNAVFGIDPPLDHLDFVEYCQREIERDCSHKQGSEAGKAEAEWVLNYYFQHFGDHLKQAENYIANSCFTVRRSDGGNAAYLKGIPVHLFHEIDPMWLTLERCRDISDANALVGSKLINFLQQSGSTESMITLTTDKGFRADGTRHPHSWSIADPDTTLLWLKQYMK